MSLHEYDDNSSLLMFDASTTTQSADHNNQEKNENQVSSRHNHIISRRTQIVTDHPLSLGSPCPESEVKTGELVIMSTTDDRSTKAAVSSATELLQQAHITDLVAERLKSSTILPTDTEQQQQKQLTDHLNSSDSQRRAADVHNFSSPATKNVDHESSFENPDSSFAKKSEQGSSDGVIGASTAMPSAPTRPPAAVLRLEGGGWSTVADKNEQANGIVREAENNATLKPSQKLDQGATERGANKILEDKDEFTRNGVENSGIDGGKELNSVKDGSTGSVKRPESGVKIGLARKTAEPATVNGQNNKRSTISPPSHNGTKSAIPESSSTSSKIKSFTQSLDTSLPSSSTSSDHRVGVGAGAALGALFSKTKSSQSLASNSNESSMMSMRFTYSKMEDTVEATTVERVEEKPRGGGGENGGSETTPVKGGEKENKVVSKTTELVEGGMGNTKRELLENVDKMGAKAHSLSDLSTAVDELRNSKGEIMTPPSKGKSNRCEAPKSTGKKKQSVWYTVLNSTYKLRHEEFKRIFKDIPRSERLIVDYSCALQKNILVHGRMYISEAWVCFYANIFGVETSFLLQFKDIVQITKMKTVLLFSNAIQIATKDEKYFITSLNSRDKTFLILSHLWQNMMSDQRMSDAEMWNMIHYGYGSDLGLSPEDTDYLEPSAEDRSQFKEKIEAAENLVQCSDGVGIIDEAKESEYNEAVKEQENHLVTPQSTSPPTSPARTKDHGKDAAAELVAVVHCESHEHLPIKVVDEIFNFPVNTLFDYCLSNSKIYQQFVAAKRTTEVVHNEWSDSVSTEKGTTRIRNVSYTLAMNFPVGPKTAPTTEVQTMHSCCKSGEFYLVDSECTSASLPYGENFFITNRYCMSRVTDTTSRLRITSRINFRKSVWGIVKSIIDKNATAGILESFGLMVNLLRRESGGDQSNEADKLSASNTAENYTECSSVPSADVKVLSGSTSTHGRFARVYSHDVASRKTSIIILVLLVCNALLLYDWWTRDSLFNNQLHSTSPASLQSIEAHIAEQQYELDRVKAVLHDLTDSVHRMSSTLSDLLLAVKHRKQ